MEAAANHSLELINARFAQIQKKNEEIRKKKRIHKKILVLLGTVFVCTFVLWLCMPAWMDRRSPMGAAGSAKRASITGKYKSILSPKEIEEWNYTMVQSGKIYIKMKTELQIIGGTTAYIRLINPPYCMYDCKFAIAESDTGEIFYESDTLEPGEILEYASLNRIVDYGETPVDVTLQFSRHGKSRVIRTIKTEAVLITAK